MNIIQGVLTVAELILRNINSGGSTSETQREIVQDPQLLAQITTFQKQNEMLMEKYESLLKQIKNEQFESFDDLQKFDKKAAEALIKLALQTQPMQTFGRNFGFFGLTSSGKSTIINSLIGNDVAQVGSYETTK